MSANPAFQSGRSTTIGGTLNSGPSTGGCPGAAARVGAAFLCVALTMLESVEDAPTPALVSSNRSIPKPRCSIEKVSKTVPGKRKDAQRRGPASGLRRRLRCDQDGAKGVLLV